LVSDVVGYASWSHDLIGRSGGWHLPGYPLLIAIARALTFNLAPDVFVMVALSFAAWVLSLALMARILEALAPDLLGAGVLMYGLFPLVGITNIAFPLADTTAQCFFLAAFYATLKNRKWPFLLMVAMGLTVHMVLWPFLFMLSIVWLVRRRLTIWHVLLSGVPLGLYYLAIGLSSGDWLWFFRTHYAVNFESSGRFPVFGALVGPFETNSVTGLFKGILIGGVIVVTTLLGWFAWKRRDLMMLTIVLPLLLFAATVNAYEGFIIVRYADFVVIPLCLWAAASAGLRTLFTSRQCLVAMAVLLVLSQWVWAVYTVKFFER
jgi:hypothetical protein